MPLQRDRVLPLPALRAKSIVRGQLLQESPDAFLARFARAFASCTITVTGTLANNDQLRVNVNLPILSGGQISKTVVLTGADTTTTAAQKIAKALCDDPVLQSYGAYATALSNVVSFYWPGLLGNVVTLSSSVPVGSGVITLGASGVMSGGSGPIIPYGDFNFMWNGNLFSFRAGEPEIVPQGAVQAMAAAKAQIQ